MWSNTLTPMSLILSAWITIANISTYFKCIVCYCCSRENETWRQYSCKHETPNKKLTNCSNYFTVLQCINNLETQGHIKRRLISRISVFLKKKLSSGLKIIYLFVKWTKLFTKYSCDANFSKSLLMATKFVLGELERQLTLKNPIEPP